MYKAADLRERTVEDLKELERTLAKELFSSRFKNFTNRLDDTSSLSKGRRDLARIKTVLLEKLRVSTAGAPAPAKKPAAKKAAAPKAEAAPPAAPSKPAAAAEAAPEAPPSKTAPKKKAAAKKTTAKKKSEE